MCMSTGIPCALRAEHPGAVAGIAGAAPWPQRRNCSHLPSAGASRASDDSTMPARRRRRDLTSCNSARSAAVAQRRPLHRKWGRRYCGCCQHSLAGTLQGPGGPDAGSSAAAVPPVRVPPNLRQLPRPQTRAQAQCDLLAARRAGGRTRVGGSAAAAAATAALSRACDVYSGWQLHAYSPSASVAAM